MTLESTETARLQMGAPAADAKPGADARADARRRAILDAARQIFLTRGYEGASMSEVAANLGGSKGTLYNYFRSKDELFRALMNDVCRDLRDALDALPPASAAGPLRESLVELGYQLMTHLLAEPMIAIHRLVVAEAGRFPELGRLFYETGPARGEERFTDYFAAAMAARRLPPADPRIAGARLKDLVLSDVYMRRLWGVQGEMPPAALRAHVAASVDVFLRAFGADQPSLPP